MHTGLPAQSQETQILPAAEETADGLRALPCLPDTLLVLAADLADGDAFRMAVVFKAVAFGGFEKNPPVSGNTDAFCFLPRYFGLLLRSRACFAPAWCAASSPSSFVACKGRDEDFGQGTAGCALPYGKHPQIWRGSAYKYPSPLILISARPRAGIGAKLLWAARLALCSPGRLPGKAAPAFGEPKAFVRGGGEPPGLGGGGGGGKEGRRLRISAKGGCSRT